MVLARRLREGSGKLQWGDKQRSANWVDGTVRQDAEVKPNFQSVALIIRSSSLSSSSADSAGGRCGRFKHRNFTMMMMMNR